jgi:hypothetical protein
MKIPEKVQTGGLDPESRETINAVIDYLRSAEPRDSATVAVSKSTSGTHFEVKKPSRGGETTPRWG